MATATHACSTGGCLLVFIPVAAQGPVSVSQGMLVGLSVCGCTGGLGQVPGCGWREQVPLVRCRSACDDGAACRRAPRDGRGPLALHGARLQGVPCAPLSFPLLVSHYGGASLSVKSSAGACRMSQDARHIRYRVPRTADMGQGFDGIIVASWPLTILHAEHQHC